MMDTHQRASGVQVFRKSRVRKYDIPIKFFMQIADAEVHLMGEYGIPYPYDTGKTIPRLLRELADEIEESAHD